MRRACRQLLAATILALSTVAPVSLVYASDRGDTETRVVLVGSEGRATEPLQAGVEYSAFIFVLPTDEGYEVCPSPTGTVTVLTVGPSGAHVEVLTVERRFAGTGLTFTEPGLHRVIVLYSGDENCRRSRYSERWEVA